jgi:hypothetical protein
MVAEVRDALQPDERFRVIDRSAGKYRDEWQALRKLSDLRAALRIDVSFVWSRDDGREDAIEVADQTKRLTENALLDLTQVPPYATARHGRIING